MTYIISFFIILIYTKYYISINNYQKNWKQLGVAIYLALSSLVILMRIILNIAGISFNPRMILVLTAILVCVTEYSNGMTKEIMNISYEDNTLVIRFMNTEFNIKVNKL